MYSLKCQIFSALKSNRFIPKNLCAPFPFDGVSPLSADTHYDTSVESKESIKARFRNLDEFGKPIEYTGHRFRRATDRFNTFGNQNSFIENEPKWGNLNSFYRIILTNLIFFRYTYQKTRNFFHPSTKIGQEADLQSQQIFWSNAGRFVYPQTAEGRKLFQEYFRLNRAQSSQFFRNADILRQVENESMKFFIHYYTQLRLMLHLFCR